MKKLTQRAFAWLLVLVMVLSAVPFGVFAEGESPDAGAGVPAADVQAEGQTEEKETPKTNETPTTNEKETPKTEEQETPKAENGENLKTEDEKNSESEGKETPKTEKENEEKPQTEAKEPQKSEKSPETGSNVAAQSAEGNAEECKCRYQCVGASLSGSCTVCRDYYYDNNQPEGENVVCKGRVPGDDECICTSPGCNVLRDLRCKACVKNKENCLGQKKIAVTCHPNNGEREYVVEVPYNGTLNEFPKNETKRRFDGWYYDEALTQPVGNDVFREDKTVYARWLRAEDAGTIHVRMTIDGELARECYVSVAGAGYQQESDTYFRFLKPGTYAVTMGMYVNGVLIENSQQVTVVGTETQEVEWNYIPPQLETKVAVEGAYKGKIEADNIKNVAMAYSEKGTKAVKLELSVTGSEEQLTLSMKKTVDDVEEPVTDTASRLCLRINAGTVEKGWLRQIKTPGDSLLPGGNDMGYPYYVQDGNDLLLYVTEMGTYTITKEYVGTVKVSFDLNGEGKDVVPPEPIEVTKGSSYLIGNLPEVEAKGYFLECWSYDEAGTQRLYPTMSLNTSDNCTLYAQWRERHYTLDYGYTPENGDRYERYTISQYPIDSSYPTLEREGYVFRGWYNDTGVWVEKATYGSEITTLTARWTKVDINTVTGVSIPMPSAAALDKIIKSSQEAQTVTLACNDNVNASDKEAIAAQAGDDATYYDLSVMVDGEKKSDLGASLVFEVQRQEADPVVYRKHGNAAPEKMTKLSAKPEEGSSVEGYYVDGNTILIYTHSFSTYAVANSDTVTITYHDGTADTANKDVAVSVKKGEKFQPSAMPDGWTKTGYSLEKWEAKADDQTVQEYELDQQYEATADQTLTAVWEPITYTVTFDGNGGTLKGTNPVDATYDVAVKAPTAARTYYTLLGWATKADAKEPEYAEATATRSGTELKPLINLTAKDGGKVTLYAVWSYVPRDITLDAKGGTLTDANGKDVKTLTVRTTAARDEKGKDYNVLTAASLQTPAAPEGKTFAGWYTTEDSKGVQIEANDIIPDSVTTLYAHWNDFQSVDVTLKAMGGTMKLDGKTVREGKIATKWPGVLSQTLPTPARTGYKFLGWYTADGYKVDQDTRYTGTTNVIYAHWERAVSRTGNPKTGDQVRLDLAVAVLAVAAVGLTTAVVLRKRKK